MHHSKRGKVLASLLTVGVLGAVASFGIFGAFSASTDNQGNQFSAATLELDNNSHSAPVYLKSDALPGDKSETGNECIKISYASGVPASLKLFGDTVGADGLEDYVNLAITAGAGDQEDCSDFSPAPEGSGVFSGTLADFQEDHTSWETGIELGAIADEESVTFQFETELDAEAPSASVQGLDSGDQTFTWEVQAGSSKGLRPTHRSRVPSPNRHGCADLS